MQAVVAATEELPGYLDIHLFVVAVLEEHSRFQLSLLDPAQPFVTEPLAVAAKEAGYITVSQTLDS